METQEKRFERFRELTPKDAADQLNTVALNTFNAMEAVQSTDQWFCDDSVVTVELPAGQWFTVLTALYAVADQDAHDFASPNSGLDYALIGNDIVQACVAAKSDTVAA